MTGHINIDDAILEQQLQSATQGLRLQPNQQGQLRQLAKDELAAAEFMGLNPDSPVTQALREYAAIKLADDDKLRTIMTAVARTLPDEEASPNDKRLGSLVVDAAGIAGGAALARIGGKVLSTEARVPAAGPAGDSKVVGPGSPIPPSQELNR